MKILATLIATLALAGCSTLWMDPIRQVAPDTFQVTHTMGTFSPVKGVRQGVIDRATEKCASLGKNYAKVREEMIPAGNLSYTLTFKCQ